MHAFATAIGGRIDGKEQNEAQTGTEIDSEAPDLEQSKAAVLNSLTSPSSQRTYDHAIREFIEWYCSEPRLAFNKTVVTQYRINLEQQHYASTTINLRLAAIRRLAYELRLRSTQCRPSCWHSPGKGAKRLGVRVGNCLVQNKAGACCDYRRYKPSR